MSVYFHRIFNTGPFVLVVKKMAGALVYHCTLDDVILLSQHGEMEVSSSKSMLPKGSFISSWFQSPFLQDRTRMVPWYCELLICYSKWNQFNTASGLSFMPESFNFDVLKRRWYRSTYLYTWLLNLDLMWYKDWEIFHLCERWIGPHKLKCIHACRIS